MSNRTRALVTTLLDAIAPPRCMRCARISTWYCAECRALAPIHPLSCIVCKQEHRRGITCLSCRETTPLRGCVSAGPYSDHALSRGVEWLKFKGVREMSTILAGVIIPRLSAVAPIENLSTKAILVPMPLYPRKFRDRGFNQSEDIARAIGAMCGIEVANILQRISATHAQAQLPHEFRTENVRNAFGLAITEREYASLTQKKPIIIVVDDVSTTGATLTAAAQAFPEDPNVQIWGAVGARG